MGMTARSGRCTTALVAVLVSAVAGTTLTVSPQAARARPSTTEHRSFTVSFTGDLIAHVGINKRARALAGGTGYDYAPLFGEVQSVIEASDLAICSLEGPIAPAGSRYTGSPVFGSPADIARSIKAVGYDRCTLATNHSNDRGPAGIAATIDAFDAAGLGHSGSGKDDAGATAEVFEVNGVRVAHLAYTGGVSGQRRLLTKTPARVNILSAGRVIADAKDARVRGAEIVLVSLHWGVEYRRSITDAQRRVADAITASGEVDLIAGSHAHVLQPIKQVNGKWVLFGLGNHLSTQNDLTIGRPSTADGVIVTVRFTEQEGGGFAAAQPVVTPTWVHHRKYYIMKVADHLADTSLPRDVLACLRAAWRRINALYGGLVEPLPA